MPYNWPTMPGTGTDPYQALLQSLFSINQGGDTGSPEVGSLRDPGTGSVSRGTQFAPPDLQPGQPQRELPPGWLATPEYYPEGKGHMAKVGTAKAATSPLVKALISALTPVPGSAVGWAGNRWLNANVGSGNTARALGLGYLPPTNPDDQMVDNPQEFYRDPQGGRGMMNPQAQQYSDPRRINMSSFHRIWGK